VTRPYALRVTRAPRVPTDVDTPLLDTVIVTPGMTLKLFRATNPIASPCHDRGTAARAKAHQDGQRRDPPTAGAASAGGGVTHRREPRLHRGRRRPHRGPASHRPRVARQGELPAADAPHRQGTTRV